MSAPGSTAADEFARLTMAAQRKALELLDAWTEFNGDDPCNCVTPGADVYGLCSECGGTLVGDDADDSAAWSSAWLAGACPACGAASGIPCDSMCEGA